MQDGYNIETGEGNLFRSKGERSERAEFFMLRELLVNVLEGVGWVREGGSLLREVCDNRGRGPGECRFCDLRKVG